MKIPSLYLTDRQISWLFFLLGGLPGMLFAAHKGYIYFYQNFAPESIMWACGLGMRHPGEVLEPLSKFTYGQLRVFDCGVFDNLQSPDPVAFFAKTQPYFTWPSAVLWRVFGLNYYAILPLVYLLYAIYGAGVLALSRLFLGRKLAILAALLLCLAPLTVGMSLYLRDFSKAPFFIWAIVFLIQAIRERNLARSLMYSAASAVVVGIGFGFRADLIVLFPIGAVILAIGVRPVSQKSGRPVGLAGIIAPIVFLVTGTTASAPVWLQMDIGSSGGSAIIQGASEYFRISSGLTRSAYTIGWTYSDELTLSGITAEERPENPNWDDQESEPLQGPSQAQKLSTKNLLGWADIFAADYFAQALKSAGWILGLPTYIQRENLAVLFAKTNAKGRFLTAKATLPIYHLLGQFWFPLVGLIGALVLLWRRFVVSGREALSLTLLFGFLTTYPALQFSARHIFHLEFVWIISTLSLFAVLFDPPQPAERRKKFAIYVAGFAFAIAASYGAAIWWQNKTLPYEIAKLLGSPKETVETERHQLSNGDVFYNVKVPARYQALIDSAPDSMTPQIRYKGIQWSVKAAADRLLVQLDGEQCENAGRSVQFRYYHGPEVWQPFDTEHFFAENPKSGISSALFPAFYRPTQHFAGILVPRKYSKCRVKISRIIGDSRLPMVLTANVDLLENGGAIAGPGIKWPGGFSTKVDKTTVTRKLAKPKDGAKEAEAELKKLLGG